MIKKIKKIWGNAKLNSDSITNVAILDGGIEKSKLQIIKNKLISAFGIKSEKIENVYFPLIVLIHTLKGAYGIQIKSNMKREILKWED
jgi:fatty acid-binding protein DegV